jgi:heat shock protein HslJ
MKCAMWVLAGKVTGAVLLVAVSTPSDVLADQGGTTSGTHPLADTSWRLVEFQSMDDAIGKVKPPSSSVYTMRLHGDSSVTMQLDCNRARGSWSAEPAGDGSSGRFTFGPLAGTRALCPPPRLDEMITAQSVHVRSYLLREGRLYLSLMADAGIFAWEPESSTGSAMQTPASPEDGGPRNWEVTGVSTVLNLRQEPSTRASVIARYVPGTILDNLGCRRAEGRVWCDVQELGGGPRGFVAADYLEPAVSPDGSVALGPDDSALRAGQSDFDATGELPCAQSPDQPMSTCEFAVARSGGGYATVVITKPDGRTRIVYFRMGRAIGAGTSEAEGEFRFRARRDGDLHRIHIGDERYEIPDAVVLGG